MFHSHHWNSGPDITDVTPIPARGDGPQIEGRREEWARKTDLLRMLPLPVCRDSVRTSSRCLLPEDGLFLTLCAFSPACHWELFASLLCTGTLGFFQNCPTQCLLNILFASPVLLEADEATSHILRSRAADVIHWLGQATTTHWCQLTDSWLPLKLNLSSKLCLWEGVQLSCVRMQEKWFLLLLQLFHQRQSPCFASPVLARTQGSCCTIEAIPSLDLGLFPLAT